mgnify:CR=1 FL=1
MRGKLEYLSATPDEAFSAGMMGDGVVIFPEEGIVHAPCDGEITFVFPTKHAIGMKDMFGYEILVHVGVSSVKLEGEGFQVLVKEGDKVKRGDILLEFNLELLKEKADSPATPVILTNLNNKMHVECKKPGIIEVGEEIFRINM